ncbi:MAG: hypothetical protein Q7R43_06895 [Candidatus Daviesbacteria bacterium]|nr:hypothetical protein [Candidatus Daviesbacteria bacterium]
MTELEPRFADVLAQDGFLPTSDDIAEKDGLTGESSGILPEETAGADFEFIYRKRIRPWEPKRHSNKPDRGARPTPRRVLAANQREKK